MHSVVESIFLSSRVEKMYVWLDVVTLIEN